MRKASETKHDVAVPLGEIEVPQNALFAGARQLRGELTEQLDTALLHLDALGVHEWHVQKHALVAHEVPIEAERDA